MKLPYNIVKQVPGFLLEYPALTTSSGIVSQYPAFVEFLKAYYTWLSTNESLGRYEDLIDIDNTIDGFIQYFRKELDVYGLLATTNNKLYLKHIKELYESKGSSDTYKFLFKLLFNKDSSIIQPWDSVFKPSQSTWVQKTSILVNVLSGDVSTINGQTIILTDASGVTYNTSVQDIITRQSGTVEIFIKRFPFKDVLKSVTSQDGTFEGAVVNTTVTAKIDVKGVGFKAGDIFNIKSFSGAGTLIKVKAVDATGGITSVEIIGYGEGYNTSFNVMIFPSGSSYQSPSALANIKLDLNGNLRTYKTLDNIQVSKEQGQIVTHNYTRWPGTLTDSYLEDLSYVGTVNADFKNEASEIRLDQNYAIISFTLGQVCVYPGYYLQGYNILGDAIYIQDSEYYQAFSYVTSLEEELSTYGAVLKKVLHPAGLKHFANYEANNNFLLNTTADSNLNIIIPIERLADAILVVGDLYNYFTKAPIVETVHVASLSSITYNSYKYDTVASTNPRPVFNIQPKWVQLANVADNYTRIINWNRSYTDAVAVLNPRPVFNIQPKILSTVNTVSPAPKFDITLSTIYETVGVAAIPKLQPIKNVFDTVTSSTSYYQNYTTKRVFDTPAINTVFLRTVNWYRTYTDLGSVVDLPQKNVSLAPFIDGSSTADQRYLDVTANKADSATTADQLSRIVDWNKIYSDTGITVDQYSRVINWLRTYTDSAATSEVTSRYTTKANLDGASTSDFLSRTVNFLRTVNDTGSVSEAYSRLLGWVRSFSDSTAVSDIKSITVTPAKHIDTVYLTENVITSLVNAFRTVPETVFAADTLFRVVTWLRTYTDSAATSDSNTKAFAKSKISDSTIGFTDAYSRVVTWRPNYTESVASADARTFTIDAAKKYDTVTINSVSTILLQLKPFTENVTSYETFVKLASWNKTYTDTSSVAENLSRIVTWGRTPADTAYITEQPYKSLSQSKRYDTATTSDSYFKLNPYKYKSDVVTTSTSGAYFFSSYVQPAATDGSTYWPVGYAENEYTLTS